MKKNLAFVFPGQGSQSVGMGSALATRFDDFSEIYQETLASADKTLGFELSKIIQDGPAEKLKETEITQPALLAVSTAMSRWLQENDIIASTSLGHSLGEYSALVYSGSMDFEDALRVVHLRGKYMSEAVPSGTGGMAALVGASADDASKLCKAVTEKEPSLILEASAYNCSGQVVISGHMKAIDYAVEMAKDIGIRKAAKLEVSGPFHCSLLAPAGEKLGKALEEVEIRRPKHRVIANVSALPEFEPTEIRKNLIAQVSKPVLWSDSIRYVGESEDGVEFAEVGSGKVLSGLIKKILPEAKCTALDSLQRIDVLAA